MTALEVIFYFLAASAVLSALGILLTKNVLHGAFLLVLAFFCVAGLYVLANAGFIGVTQLLIYIGGILVLMIFGIMLTNKLKGQPLLTENSNQLVGVVIGLGFILSLMYILLGVDYQYLDGAVQGPVETIQFIGINLLSTYLIPFEVAAILLLVALIGASVISEKRKEEES